jgi:5-methylcytosine-specific restriction protein B
MMPNSDLFTKNKSEITIETRNVDRDSDIKVGDINIRLMLNAINERIEYIYDREHTIGHSYFMDLLEDGCNTKDKLDEIFRVNIIPLLAEYFYGDWGDIKVVLNDDNNYFITEKKEPIYIIKNDRKKDTVYLVNKTFNTSGYENIYLLADKKD